MRIFITGASGLLGQAIVDALVRRGDEAVALSRRARPPAAPGIRWVVGDPASGHSAATASDDWTGALAGCDAVVHLAGEPIGDKRWNEERKARICASRIDGTRGLVAALGRIPAAARPRVLVVANGIDYYPFDASETPWAEDGVAGAGFLEDLCAAWQAEAERATDLDVRVVTMRTGIVLSRDGGALPSLVRPFRMFAGGRIGHGRQWFSWVHVDDVVRAYLFAIDHPELAGPVNLVAPTPVRAADLARARGTALRRPAWFPVPRFALKLAAGEIAGYLAEGRKVVPTKLLAAGFAFAHPDLAGALDGLVGRRPS